MRRKCCLSTRMGWVSIDCTPTARNIFRKISFISRRTENLGLFHFDIGGSKLISISLYPGEEQEEIVVQVSKRETRI